MLEKLLNSWSPRRPSAGLKRRIFVASGRAAATPSAHWLAPVTGCLLLAFVTFSPRMAAFGNYSASMTNGSFTMAAISNSSLAAFLPHSLPLDWNVVQVTTFESTNRSHSPSSMGSFPGPMPKN